MTNDVIVPYDIAREAFLPQNAAKYPGLVSANTPNGAFCASANAVGDCEERSSEQLPNDLRTLFWEATLRCNAYCEFCGSRCGDVPSEEVSGEEVIRTLRRIAEAYDPADIMLNVTGGEPLLREDLFRVCAAASAMGYPWGLVTNGSQITEEAVEKMRKSGMRTISISLDGMAERHNALRRIPDGFAKVERAVRLLADAGFLDCIQITTVVNRQNLGELEALYQCLLTWPIDSWRVGTVDPIGRAKEKADLLLDAEGYRGYLDFLRDHQFNSPFEVTTTCSHYYGREDNLYRRHPFVCGAGKTVASILSNGDIYVCPNVPRRRELIQGNILRDDFVELWERGFSWFRDEDSRRCGPCASCGEWDVCRGESLHTWDFEEKVPGICMKEVLPYILTPADPGRSGEILDRIRANTDELIGVRRFSGNRSGKVICLTPAAAEELYAYFNWGRATARNVCELLAGLAGHVTGDHMFIEAILPAPLEHRDLEEAVFSERNRRDVMTDLAALNRHREMAEPAARLFDGEYQLLGYVHSHPGNLDVTMSRADMESHRVERTGGTDWITMICNPQKRRLQAYVNSVYYPVDVIILMEKRDLSRWEGEKEV